MPSWKQQNGRYVMKDSKPSTLGDLFREYHYCQNPVTKAVLMQCIRDRLDKLERGVKEIGYE
jgi:hypothetical protein